MKVSRSVVSDSLPPHGLWSPWNSPGQGTGVGSLSLLQGSFPTQGSNPGLLHCRRILYQLSPQGSWARQILSFQTASKYLGFFLSLPSVSTEAAGYRSLGQMPRGIATTWYLGPGSSSWAPSLFFSRRIPPLSWLSCRSWGKDCEVLLRHLLSSPGALFIC